MSVIADEVLEFKTLVVVGLGNPGSRYNATRHNAGFELLDLIANKFGCQLRNDNEKAAGFVTVNGKSILMVKPLTFMNRSGEPLKRLCSPKGYQSDQLLVLHDELDLPTGTIRVKVGGGEGGHNGLRSISECFGTKEYARMRIGIGKPEHPDFKMTDWVLGKFSNDERTLVNSSLDLGVQAIERILLEPTIKQGLIKSQSWLNSF